MSGVVVTEEALSSPSSPLLSFMSISPAALRNLNSDERGLFLIHLLLNCASHVSAGNLEQANAFLEHISFLSSPDGDAMQRIASYFTEALARRLLRSWPGLYRALNPISADNSASARRLFFDFFPFLRLSFLVSNQAIIEAMQGEKLVHVIDLGGSDSSQWLSLLQNFSSQPQGPPHLRITAIGEDKDCLLQNGSLLSKEAEKLDIPFQYNAIVSKLECLNVESLRVKTGEAVAISSVLQLHLLLRVKMESFLASLWGLCPKIMVVTEQESNHNGECLNERFVEALNFYAAMFDCLETTLPRQSVERLGLEKKLFGEEIKNIVGCEGVERRERHEKLEKWVLRLEMAGFGKVGLSYYGMLQARRMLESFGCEGYRVREENGCFFFCWQDRALFSVSAWRFRRFD